MLAPNCVYCIWVGKDAVCLKNVSKFGMTKDLSQRLITHGRTYPYMKLLWAISTGALSSGPAEITIKLSGEVRSRSVRLSVDDCTRMESLSYVDANFIAVNNNIIADVMAQYGLRCEVYKTQQDKKLRPIYHVYKT